MEYIHCDCTDCGFSRYTGPCILENTFLNNDIDINKIRDWQKQTKKYQEYKQIAKNKPEFTSVLRVSVI